MVAATMKRQIERPLQPTPGDGSVFCIASGASQSIVYYQGFHKVAYLNNQVLYGPIEFRLS